jgi:secreted protein with Ig-like and vWFA domain
MQQGNKIGKAQEALKQAISELKPTDSFNIITFAARVDGFSNVMLAATKENVEQADEFIDLLRLRGGTNISGALEIALSLEGITHIFLLSDGEPMGGITDPDQIRAMVREFNTQKAQIITLALGLGEQFRGMALLKGLAEDNNGKFSYVNLAR